MESKEQLGTGITKWAKRSNGTVNFVRKGGPDPLFGSFSVPTEPIHSVLDRNFRKFWSSGSRPSKGGPRFSKLFRLDQAD